jgi:hypothetical protein
MGISGERKMPGSWGYTRTNVSDAAIAAARAEGRADGIREAADLEEKYWNNDKATRARILALLEKQD